MARLFFAIWPDARAAAALSAIGSEIAGRQGGRTVPAAKLHLTLVFLGEVDSGRAGLLNRAAQETSGGAFSVELDQIGSFRRAGVAWAGCRQASAELLALQASLSGRLREAGFRIEERAFAPHLTLVRRLHGPVESVAIEAIAWRTESIVLVESVSGEGVYRKLAEWSLEREKT